jgi:hypothetical protein
VLEDFDAHQLAAVAEFLARTTDLIYRHAAMLRAETVSGISSDKTNPQHSHRQEEKRIER